MLALLVERPSQPLATGRCRPSGRLNHPLHKTGRSIPLLVLVHALLGPLVTRESIRLRFDIGALPPIGLHFPGFLDPTWCVCDAERCLPCSDARAKLPVLATSLGAVRRMGEEVVKHSLALRLAETRIFPEVVR